MNEKICIRPAAKSKPEMNISLKSFGIAMMLVFLASASYAQRRDTSDYFCAGAFFGNYSGLSAHHGDGVVNSFGAELEYYKFRDLSFYAQGIYKFTGGHDHGFHPPYPIPVTDNDEIPLNDGPSSTALSFSFGGRYYFRSSNVNPFVQFGLNQEFNFEGGHGEHHDSTDAPYFHGGPHSQSYNFALGIGAGVSIKADPKLKFELKYEAYRSLLSEHEGGSGYLIVGGAKYNF